MAREKSAGSERFARKGGPSTKARDRKTRQPSAKQWSDEKLENPIRERRRVMRVAPRKSDSSRIDARGRLTAPSRCGHDKCAHQLLFKTKVSLAICADQSAHTRQLQVFNHGRITEANKRGEINPRDFLKSETKNSPPKVVNTWSPPQRQTRTFPGDFVAPTLHNGARFKRDDKR